MLGPLESGVFLVDPDNWETLQVFLMLSTQWRWIAGMGGAIRTGMDYSALESVMRLLKIKDRTEMFNGLLIMEAAALEKWNE